MVVRSVTPRYSWVLLLLIAAASMLAATMPGDAAARSLFQSSPPGFRGTPAPPVTPSASRTPRSLASPVLTPATQTPTRTPQPAPTSSPVPTPSPLPGPQRTATAVAAVFLPAPTLTSPDAAGPGGLLPGSQPPLNAPKPRSATATPAPAGSSLGRLIESGLVIVSYLWLFCGAVAVAGIAVGAFWYFRKHP